MGFLSVLIIGQIPATFVWGLSFDGCSKYMQLEAVQSLQMFTFQIWAVSLALHSVAFFWVFPIATLAKSRAAKIALGAGLIWKASSLLFDQGEASGCGENRDYVLPFDVDVGYPDVLFFMSIVCWCVFVIALLAASIRPKKYI